MSVRPGHDGVVAARDKGLSPFVLEQSYVAKHVEVAKAGPRVAVHVRLWVVVWAILGAASSSSGQVPVPEAASVCEEPTLAELSVPPPPVAPLRETAYDPIRGSDPDVDLGIGQLRSIGDFAWDWTTRLRLPLFSGRGGSLSHWIVDGWLMPASGDPRPLGVAGLTETDYEIPVFIVFEHERSGWVQLRFDAGNSGVGWTHGCFFGQTSGGLEVERWEARFLSGEISPLYFRAQVRHALRAEPTQASQRLLWISSNPGDYALAPLEIRGDWMRVELREPSDYCRDPDRPAVTVTEGWIQWRDDERGPWLWYYTRGC